MATKLPDDTRQGARDLGFLDNFRKIRGSFRISDRKIDLDDFYKFKVASNQTNVVLSLRNLQADADLRLLNSAGTTIGVSRRRGTRNERIEQKLDTGDYFIQVSQDGVNTRYTLIASPADAVPGPNPSPTPGPGGTPSPTPTPFPPAISPSSEPGDRLTTAFNIGVLNGKIAYKETLSRTDTADFYQFTLNQSSTVRILTNGVQGGDVSTALIYDISGNEIVDSQDVLSSGATINKALGAGTYFVRLNPQTLTGDQLSYTLQLQQDAIANISPVADPPLGLGGATDLGLLSGSRELRQIVSTSNTANPALVGTFDSTDIYKFTLASEASNFSVLLNTTQTTGDLTLSLIYDENGNGIANPGTTVSGLVILGDFPGGVFTGSSEGGSALTINKTLGAGTYFLAVTQREVTDNTTYGLNLFVNNSIAGLSPIGDVAANGSVINGNGSVRTAFNIGTLSQNVSFKQFVGTTDSSDFYSFTLSRERNVVIRYNGSPELVGIRFGQDRNGNGVLDPVGSLLPEPKTGLEGEIFQPSLTGEVVFSPLPPFYDPAATFEPAIEAFLTAGSPVDIYAKLPAGTYVVQIDPQTVRTDLGDTLERYGSANILYNLAFILDGP